MGKIKKADLVNYTVHVFTAGNSDFWLYEYGIIKELENIFGEIDYISKPIDFQRFTTYYNKEMGENIKIEGRMISFKNLGSPSFLADAKILSNKIESKHSIDGRRKVNIDIGYVHHTQFVLASTKHWGNRLYIGKGIYAEITLMYNYGEWKDLEFSYANFKDPVYKAELSLIRDLYMKKRKKL